MLSLDTLPPLDASSLIPSMGWTKWGKKEVKNTTHIHLAQPRPRSRWKAKTTTRKGTRGEREGQRDLQQPQCASGAARCPTRALARSWLRFSFRGMRVDIDGWSIRSSTGRRRGYIVEPRLSNSPGSPWSSADGRTRPVRAAPYRRRHGGGRRLSVSSILLRGV